MLMIAGWPTAVDEEAEAPLVGMDSINDSNAGLNMTSSAPIVAPVSGDKFDLLMAQVVWWNWLVWTPIACA
jgi:hypothetical protein